MATTRLPEPTAEHPAPVLTTTRYDAVSSFLIALVLGLGLAVAALILLWSTTWTWPAPDAVPVEMMDVSGGFDDGNPDETIELDTPEDPSQDPSLAEIQDPETQVQETVEDVIEASDQAVELAEDQLRNDPLNAGPPGSARGTGGRPLGFGPGTGGVPRANRWFVAFSDRDTLQTYAAQLEFFGIRIGIRLGNRIVFLTNLTAPTPGTETVTKGDPDWLFFTWRGGGRRQADLELLRKAGVDPGAGSIIHLYSDRAEQEMARKELEYADGRTVDQIRRTYFTVTGTAESGFEFVVTRQSYFN